MVQIIEQNSGNQPGETSGPSLSAASSEDVSAPEVSHDSALPTLVGEDQTSVHLAGLADRARTYVAAASSANTCKAHAADWKHFSA